MFVAVAASDPDSHQAHHFAGMVTVEGRAIVLDFEEVDHNLPAMHSTFDHNHLVVGHHSHRMPLVEGRCYQLEVVHIDLAVAVVLVQLWADHTIVKEVVAGPVELADSEEVGDKCLEDLAD